MENIPWFISGLLLGILITLLIVYLTNKFRGQNTTLKRRNIQRLNLILVAILISYGLTALIAIIFGSWVHTFIGIAFAILVVTLGVIAVVGLYLIKDNYVDTNEESQGAESSDMISVGESLIGLSLQLLIGTIAVGLILFIITTAIQS